MHEVSIALSIMDIIVKKCREESCNKIDSVRLKIGKAAGVMPDALLFAFDNIKTDTIAKDAEMIIDIIPLGGTCNGCKRDFDTEEAYVLECPKCGSADFVINKGNEMEIIDMEVS